MQSMEMVIVICRDGPRAQAWPAAWLGAGLPGGVSGNENDGVQAWVAAGNKTKQKAAPRINIRCTAFMEQNSKTAITRRSWS
jgi:hypothetical protein